MMTLPDCTNIRALDQFDNPKFRQLGYETGKNSSAAYSDDELCDTCQ